MFVDDRDLSAKLYAPPISRRAPGNQARPKPGDDAQRAPRQQQQRPSHREAPREPKTAEPPAAAPPPADAATPPLFQPPPRPEQNISMTQDEFKRYCALRRLRPIGRSGSRTTIPLDRSDLLSHMYGMSQVTTILWNTIAKAVLLFQAYSTGVGRLGGLHFAIQGPKGCGRRSAVMSVCRQCCCDMVTVSPLRHVSGDIEYAIMYAVENNPCVIYFDGMEDLHQLPDFDNEFTKQVLGSETLCNSWNAVWLGFGVETLRELDSKMYAMCGPRIAEVEPLKPEEAIKLLANEFLCMGGARVNPPLTVDERTILNEAVQGCTPADLRNFAATVHYRALSRMTLTALSEIYNVRIFDEFRARSHGDSQQARPHTEDNQCTDSCDIVRFLEISWDPDAVGAYDFVKPDAEYGDGKEHFFVPRAHRRQ